MDLKRFADRLQTAGRGETELKHWAFFGNRSRRLTLGIKDGEAGNAHAPISISEGLGIRYRLIWSDGRVSRGYLERGQMDADPAEVLKFTRAASIDDPDAAEVHAPTEYPDVQLHSEAAAKVAQGQGSWLAERLARLREATEAPHVQTWSGSFSAGEGNSRLITSLGLDVEGNGTSIGWHCTVNGALGEGYGGRQSDPVEDFEGRLERLLRWSEALAGETASREKGVQRVLLHPDVADRYALDTLLHHLSGSTLSHGESRYPLEAFGDGKPRLPERFNLRLDPLRPLGSGSYRFSNEGVPAAPITYVERGCLVNPLLDMKYAKRLGRKPTPIPYSGEALDWDCGARLTFDQAIAGAPTLLVFSVLGIHTQDSASGDFSLSAPQVLAFEGGECRGRQNGTIAGNLFRLFEDPDFQLVDFPGEETPGMLISCRFDPR